MIKTSLLDHDKILRLLGLGSLFMMVMALFFEHVMDLHPCKMCIWQRIPHIITIIFAGLSFILKPKPLQNLLLILTCAALFSGAGIAFWHSGVELGLLEGPSSCSAAMSLTGDPSALLDQILSAPVIRCDEVPWSLFGLSMANWNFLITSSMSFLALSCLLMTRKKTKH